MTRTHNTVQTGLLSERREARYLRVRAIGHADAAQVMVVEAGQNSYCNNFGMCTCGCLGVFHHRTATGCMDRHDGGLERIDRLHRLCDGVGNVMQFQVEKDRQSQFLHFMHTMMAVGAEEFEAQFYTADMMLDPLGQFQRIFKIGRVDGDVERVGHAASPET